MKIRLTIDLELPPGSEMYSDAMMRQMLFDDYVNYVTCRHFEDAVNAFATSADLERQNGAPNQMSENWKEIGERHETFGRVTAQPQFTVERL